MIEKFTFWGSYADAALEMEDDARHEFLDAIMNYVFRGEEPVFTHAIAKAVFAVAKPSIDTSIKQAAGGKKGGASSKSAAGSTLDKNNESTLNKSAESTLNENGESTLEKNSKHYNYNYNYNYNKEKEKKKEKEKPKTQNPRFVPPSLSEVEDFFEVFAKEEGYPIDNTPAKFFDHYTSNGWKVSGKSPMKDWKASLRNWVRNNKDGTYSKRPVQSVENNPCPAYGVDWSKEGWGNVYTG